MHIRPVAAIDGVLDDPRTEFSRVAVLGEAMKRRWHVPDELPTLNLTPPSTDHDVDGHSTDDGNVNFDDDAYAGSDDTFAIVLSRCAE